MTTRRRVGREQNAARAAILDAAQILMIESGYGAVSTRRVAAQAEVTPALVQYYFPTLDALLLALYRRAADRSIQRQVAALQSSRPLHALWALSRENEQAILAVEFLALANHRPSIRSEIAAFSERARLLQADVLQRLLATAAGQGLAASAAGVSLLLAGASRALVMEEALGIVAGHAQAAGLVAGWLDRLEPSAAD